MNDALLRATAFSTEITPPTGRPLCALVEDFVPRKESLETPLVAKGLVLEQRGNRMVMAALDLLAVSNSSHDRLRRTIGQAAGCDAKRVLLHSVHQHTAPLLDPEALRLLPGDGGRADAQMNYLAGVEDNIASAVRRSLDQFDEVRGVDYASAIVERVASNRRVPTPDRSISTRWSLCWQPELRDAPEGLTDPQLDCIRFRGKSGTLACLHFFACHPQTSSGGGRVSWDVVGMARERLERETGVPQIYFTGCAGDITMGKYNSGSPEDREALADRLHAAMMVATAKEPAVTETSPRLGLQQRAIPFVERADAGHTESDLIERINTSTDRLEVGRAALELAAIRYRRCGNAVEASAITFGNLRTLHLPGEPMVAFQIFARSAAAPRPVCVAGYANGNPFYYGPDSIFQDAGGYEQNTAFAAPCQSAVEKVIMELQNPAN